MGNYYESFAPEFKSFLAALGEYNENIEKYESEEDIYELMDELKKEEYLNERLDFESLHLYDFLTCSDEKIFSDYINQCYEDYLEEYNYYEFEYGRFGPYDYYLYMLDPNILYLCGKYFDSVKEKDKADNAYFLMMCGLVSSDRVSSYWFGHESDEDYCVFKAFEFIEDKFDNVFDCFVADWVVVHPFVLWNIGKYYLFKGNYNKAKKYFEKGASIDYEGRQSIDPFIEVGKNEYELGLIYLNGLGVEIDYKKAFDLFNKAAEDAGEPSIPIIGDMYYEGLGVKRDYIKAIEMYCSYNKHNKNKYVYYKDLDDTQKEIVSSYIDSKIKNKDLSFETYSFLANVTSDKLENYDKAEELNSFLYEEVIQIPLEKRNEEMDKVYIKKQLHELESNLVIHTSNTGLIPDDLKVGDTFIFGIFNDEPIEWKVLELNDDETAFIVTTKIIVKLDCEDAMEWLNGFFYNYSFTDEERKKIEYRPYILDESQFDEFEGKYEKGSIKQTSFASSLSKIDEVLCTVMGRNFMSIKNDGTHNNIIISSGVRGIRPAMDVFYKK